MIAPTLENEYVKLSPLSLSNCEYLIHIAQEKDLIQYSPSKIDTREDLKSYVLTAVNDLNEKRAIPFIIFDKKQNVFAGCTRFGLMDWKNKVLHIGWTWIGHQFQGTGLNTQVKFLMLCHAFESLYFDKVEFRIDERNVRSRKAVEKLGAKLEGILRKDILMLDGFKRNTCCYGILKEEWPDIKNSVFSGF